MKIGVYSPSDGRTNFKLWQDHWLKEGLIEELLSRGYEVVGRKADVDIIFTGKWGLGRGDAPIRLMWFYSHPECIVEEGWKTNVIERGTHVFCISKQLMPELSQLTPNCSFLFGGTVRKHIPVTKEYEYDVVYLGNAKYHRNKFINAVGKDFKIAVVGNWGDPGVNGNVTVIGREIPNEEFGAFCNKAPLTFYWGDNSISRGFHSHKLFDVIAGSDCFMLHQYNPTLEEMIPHLKFFKTEEELVDLVRYFTSNVEEARWRAKKCREIVENYKMDYIVDKFEEVINARSN